MKRRSPNSFAIAFGMFFASILDPKTKMQTEMLDRKDSRDTTEPGRENQYARIPRLAGLPPFTRNSPFIFIGHMVNGEQ